MWAMKGKELLSIARKCPSHRPLTDGSGQNHYISDKCATNASRVQYFPNCQWDFGRGWRMRGNKILRKLGPAD